MPSTTFSRHYVITTTYSRATSSRGARITLKWDRHIERFPLDPEKTLRENHAAIVQEAMEQAGLADHAAHAALSGLGEGKWVWVVVPPDPDPETDIS